jgi:hypothetical protein
MEFYFLNTPGSRALSGLPPSYNLAAVFNGLRGRETMIVNNFTSR